MGYRKIPTIHTLTFKKYDGLVVRMRGLKIGKMRKILQVLSADEQDTLALVDAMVKFVSDGLISWTLETEDGKEVPTTAEEVEDLEFDMLSDILNAWLSEVSGPDDDLGKDSSDGGKFPGRPLTMEIL